MTHIGYKTCQNYIVTIEILGKTNEDRKDIYDKNYAEFRTSSCKVLSIIHKHTKNEINEIVGDNYRKTLLYKKNDIITVDDYDENINSTRAPGIHYFLSYEPAYYYNTKYPDFSDTTVRSEIYKRWFENGVLFNIIEINISDEEKYISEKTFYVNGAIDTEYIEKNEYKSRKRFQPDGSVRKNNEKVNWKLVYPDYPKYIKDLYSTIASTK
jgi:hypothetical protein